MDKIEVYLIEIIYVKKKHDDEVNIVHEKKYDELFSLEKNNCVKNILQFIKRFNFFLNPSTRLILLMVDPYVPENIDLFFLEFHY